MGVERAERLRVVLDVGPVPDDDGCPLPPVRGGRRVLAPEVMRHAMSRDPWWTCPTCGQWWQVQLIGGVWRWWPK